MQRWECTAFSFRRGKTENGRLLAVTVSASRSTRSRNSSFTEIARYEMPTQFLTRTVARDHELRGQKLEKGQGVLFLYRSANRDEDEFPDPDRFDIHRDPPRILSFGHGTHVCLGQHAAKLEAKVLLEGLLGAVPEYDLDESEVVPERSEFVAGYVSVPIHFTPR